MTESMKFGPEWLRNLSSDGCSGGGGAGSAGAGAGLNLTAPRYQLADHRYGREEMLALYDQNCKAPELLTTFSTLYIDKTQLPLALIQMTEDESRIWNVSVTSTGMRGRGGSVDRGTRGRGGRGGLYSSHPRSTVYDDSGDGSRLESQAYSPRGRPFDRPQADRIWSERNGGAPDPGDWNGPSTSPRKDLSRGMSGGALMEHNWRRQRSNSEDEEGWRVARGEKWGRASWRDASGTERDREDGEGDGRSGGRWEHRGIHRVGYDSSHHPPHRTSRPWEPNHHDNHDNLPEWLTENSSESGGGSFDALGAFHGGGVFSDDENEDRGHAHEPRQRRISESNNFKPSNNIKTSASSGNISSSQVVASPQLGKEKQRVQGHQQLDNRENQHAEQKQKQTQSPIKSASTSDIKKSMTASKSAPDGKIAAPVQQKKAAVVDTKVVDSSKSMSAVEKTQLIEDQKTKSPSHKPEKPILPKEPSGAKVSTEEQQQSKPDFDLDGMEAADAFVSQLMADESYMQKGVTNIPTQPPAGIDANVAVKEKWFYRDPQGEVQGPFLASEMAEWWKQGYFSASLLVRRSCDKRYIALGEFMTMCGRVPFEAGPQIPPLKASEVPNTVPNPMAANIPLPKPIEDPMVMYQFQQLQMLQNQQLVMRMRQAAIAKLSQNEHWSSLSIMEQNRLVNSSLSLMDQNQLVNPCVSSQEQEVPKLPVPTNTYVPSPLTATPSTNPLMQLISQMQQAKSQADSHTSGNTHPAVPMDPMIRLAGPPSGIPRIPSMPPSNVVLPPSNVVLPPGNVVLPPGGVVLPPTEDNDPMKILFRHMGANGQHPQQLPIDSVWPQVPTHPPPHLNAPQFNLQNWPQGGHVPTLPPGHMPSSLWDMQCKNIERDQQQQMLAKQETKQRNEELKKQEELKKKAEEEYARNKLEQEQARLIAEENKKKKEEEKKRKEEEKRKQEEQKKKKLEEEKKREEKRRLEEEINKKKEEERKLKEAKKLEEKLKKEEEKRLKMEEEQARIELERIKKEEEAYRKAEMEDENRKAEQRRRDAEALRKLQERNKAPWAQTPHSPSATAHASLAEIQRLEREKKAEEQRLQQLIQQQQQQQMAMQKASELAQEAAMDSSKRIQLKWAEKANAADRNMQVKSLAQIQHEEQERSIRVKQYEKEKQEKQASQQKESMMTLQSSGIWGTASQNLNWASSSSSAQAWGNATAMTTASASSGGGGFWDDAATLSSKSVAKATTKQVVAAAPSSSKAAAANAQPQQSSAKAGKNKNKKEEELVKKLFEQNTVKTDDFTLWCNKALAGLQVTVDIPTFIGFLRDIESPYEVKEYVRMYLGEAKHCTEFAKQFLEKRSKWRSSQRPQAQADDLCKPAPAINPNAGVEFQEVKGKTKKPKKGKMFKVDNRILGFSVTSAPDRINVGDRDYGEGM